MSIDSAMQRMAELTTLPGTTPTTPAASSAAAAQASALTSEQVNFADTLAQAQASMQDPDDGSTDTTSEDPLAGLSQISPYDASALSAAPGTATASGITSAYSDPYAVAGALQNDPLSNDAALGALGGASSLATLGALPGSSYTSALSGSTALGAPETGSSVGSTMVQLAQSQVGVTEQPPGSNDGPQIAQYRTATAGAANTPGPWCAYFVSWLAAKAGAPVGPSGSGLGYVPSLESWGKSTGKLYTPGSQAPQPGDVVIFAPGGTGLPDHTGIVKSVDPDGTIHTIEGNSANSVSERTYPPTNNGIKDFIRLG